MLHYNNIPLIDLIIMGESLEGITIRSALECFGLQVRTHFIGNVQHFLSLFKDPTFLHSFVILSCHGNEEGVLLPSLGVEIEKQMPFQKVLKTEDIMNHLSFQQQLILNTGCCLGNEAFAEAFIFKGVKNYIGVKGYIAGAAIIPFTVLFFYCYFIRTISIKEAFDQARGIDLETLRFQLLEAKQ